MKKVILSLALIVGMVFTMSTSYGQGEQIKRTPADQKNVQQSQQDSVQMFRKDAELRITNNEKRIAELNSGFMQMDPNDRVTNQNKVSELEKTNKELKKRLTDAKFEDSGKWTTFQNDYNRDMDKLTKSLKDYPPYKK